MFNKMIALRKGVAGELRKAVSPTIAIIFIVALGVVWSAISFASGFAQRQADVLPNIASMEASVLDPTCLTNANDTSETCVASRMQATSADNFRISATQLGEIGQALETTPGALRFVSHHWATTVGWIVVALIAAFHVAGEWATGSVGVTAQATGSRTRMVVLKSLSTWLISLTGLIVVAGIVAAARSTYSTTGSISNESQTGTVQLGVDSDWSSWSTALISLAITAVVLLGVSILATTIATSFRKPIPTVLIILGVVVAMFYASSLPFSPSETIAAWLNFEAVNGGLVGDHLFWSYPGSDLPMTAPTATLAPSLLSSAILMAIAIGLGAAGAFRLSHRKSL